jgi:hypothetical protein
MTLRANPRFIAAIAVPLLAAAAMPSSFARDDDDGFRARLTGFEEVHFIPGPPPALRGAISTRARGSFRAHLNKRSNQISYELRYEGLEGAVTQSHIHFGQHHTVGGITVWLCQTPTTPAPVAVAGVTPMCPQAGTVTGTISPAQVLAVVGQGIEPGEFDSLLAAMRAGVTYVNVHSTLFPPGEIRGQVGDD